VTPVQGCGPKRGTVRRTRSKLQKMSKLTRIKVIENAIKRNREAISRLAYHCHGFEPSLDSR
jgi:hypothetical protein